MITHKIHPLGSARIITLGITLLIGLALYSQLIFTIFPSVLDMATNADSLVLLDFARDLIAHTDISLWNLPRAPYLFPDTVIATIIMSLGWHQELSLLIIAAINCSILIGVSQLWISHAKGSITTARVCILICTGLLASGAIFPEAMSNLYWQLFASGAHFLTAIMVALIFYISRPKGQNQLRHGTLLLVSSLTVAEAVSDSMSLLLLMAWWVAQIYTRRTYLLKSFSDLLAIPLMLFLGTALGFLLPRQALIGSFFSYFQLSNNLHFFLSWFGSSPWNYGFIFLLILLTFAWPFLLENRWPKWRSCDVNLLIKNAFFFPSIAIFFATPLFFQEVGSLRYLAFPGLVSLLSICLIPLRIYQCTIGKRRLLSMTALISITTLIFLAQSQQYRVVQKAPTNLDKVGLSFGAKNASIANQCIQETSQQLALEDGIATYWSARPIFFASNFERYLAQTNPWRPRSGYFLWGNNGRDFVLRRSGQATRRNYNFIIATKEEIDNHFWSHISSRATRVIECPKNTIYYFDEPQILWNFLFPLGVPFDLASDKKLYSNISSDLFVNSTFPADELFTLSGIHQASTIEAIGQSGFLVFGPYIPLSAGHYRLTVFGSLSGPAGDLGILDVIASGGSKTFLKIPIPAKSTHAGIIMQAEFKIDQPVNDAEFRLSTYQQVIGQFDRYAIEKLQTSGHP